MEGSKPTGGSGILMQESAKYDGQVPFPPRVKLANQVDELLEMVRNAGVKTSSSIQKNQLRWPIDRSQSLKLSTSASMGCLILEVVNAMTEENPFLFHSRLSFALNAKILHPKEVLDRVVQEWEDRPDQISLAQIEELRQILGWRE